MSDENKDTNTVGYKYRCKYRPAAADMMALFIRPKLVPTVFLGVQHMVLEEEEEEKQQHLHELPLKLRLKVEPAPEVRRGVLRLPLHSQSLLRRPEGAGLAVKLQLQQALAH